MYGLSNREMDYIKRLVRTAVGSKRGGVQELRDVAKEKEVRRKLEVLIDANIKYPGIVRGLYEGTPMAELGRKYGISRQRVHQFKLGFNIVLNRKGTEFIQSFIYKELPGKKALTRNYPMVNYNSKKV